MSQTVPRVSDLVVCGGGAIGLALAWRAAREGLRVAVIDQRSLGRGASWAGAGILPPGARRAVFDPIEALRAASHAMFPEWCQRLSEESGVDVGFRKCGGLYVARTPVEAATLRANEAWWDEHGIEYHRWSRPDWTHFTSQLGGGGEDWQAAWYMPDEWQVRNPHYLKALRLAGQQRGVDYLEEEPVVELRPLDEAEAAVEVRTTRHRYRARAVCLTTGAWTPLLPAASLPATGIFPVRGQMLLLKLPQAPFAPVINEGHRYLVPRDDGHVLVGSCEEEVGYDERTTPSMLAELREWGWSLAPRLRQAEELKAWAGLRPGSLDGLPYLGAVPGWPKVYLAAGHYRHGLHFSPITAECLLSLIQDRPAPLDLRPFSVTRGQTFQRRPPMTPGSR